jgi:hypothetical protein
MSPFISYPTWFPDGAMVPVGARPPDGPALPQPVLAKCAIGGGSGRH